LHGSDTRPVAATLNNLAVVLKAQGRYDEAAALYRRAIRTLEGRVEPSHPTLRSARSNYAKLLRAMRSHDV
jgi:outer membrane protein TolC